MGSVVTTRGWVCLWKHPTLSLACPGTIPHRFPGQRPLRQRAGRLLRPKRDGYKKTDTYLIKKNRIVFATRLPALFGTLMTLCLCTGWVVDYFVIGMSLGTSNDGPGMPRDHPASIPAARGRPGSLKSGNSPITKKQDKS